MRGRGGTRILAAATSSPPISPGETFGPGRPDRRGVGSRGVGDRVADIGGGHGGLLAAILQAHPDMRGILFDLPETIIGAKKFLKSHGVFDRVTLVGGDFLAEIPVEADLLSC